MSTPVAAPSGAGAMAGRMIKVNHAGEFGAVNIYRAQILIGRLTAPRLIPTLQEFLAHERRHLHTFGQVLQHTQIARCRSYWLCGIGGYMLGLVTGLLGRSGIMACTAAVETVVTRHLEQQLEQLKHIGDSTAHDAVASILEDERSHQAAGINAARHSRLYRPVSVVVSGATSCVIWLGMRL